MSCNTMDAEEEVVGPKEEVDLGLESVELAQGRYQPTSTVIKFHPVERSSTPCVPGGWGRLSEEDGIS